MQTIAYSRPMQYATLQNMPRKTRAKPPLCADIGLAAVGVRVAQIWVFGTRHGQIG